MVRPAAVAIRHQPSKATVPGPVPAARLAAALLLVLVVLPAAARTELPQEKARLQVILDPLEAQPREGEMLLATVRGEYRVRIALEDLPVPRTGSFDWLQLERDHWTMEQVDGLPTQVMRRRIALFPQRSGTLTFPALAHDLTVFTADGGRAEHVVASQPLTLDVAPALGQPWLPVSAIEYSETFSRDPATLPLGETVRRRVVLRALGATEQMLPPQPDLRQPWLISFISPGRATTELTPLGPLTTLVWEWSLRPKTGERGVLPRIEIPYFDTSTRSPGALVLDAVPLGYNAAPDAAAPEIWRSDFTGALFPVAGFLLGLVAPALLFTCGTRLRTRAELSALLARGAPARRLRAAARHGDAAALRHAALTLAAALPPERAARIRAALVPLDRALYGPGNAPKVRLKALAREILGK